MMPPVTDDDLAAASALIADLGDGAAVVLLVALLRRLDTFAASMAETVQGATSGGLLGLLTGGRR